MVRYFAELRSVTDSNFDSVRKVLNQDKLGWVWIWCTNFNRVNVKIFFDKIDRFSEINNYNKSKGNFRLSYFYAFSQNSGEQ